MGCIHILPFIKRILSMLLDMHSVEATNKKLVIVEKFIKLYDAKSIRLTNLKYTHRREVDTTHILTKKSSPYLF